jgi:hypothetical protein
VQPVALVTQPGDGDNADLQVRRDGFLVELVGLPGQLDLAVERLVRDAQQRAEISGSISSNDFGPSLKPFGAE